MTIKKMPTLQEKLETLKKGVKPVTSVESAKKQLENYQKRLTASGLDASKVTDTRNEVEKFLNLPENQPFVLDALELLGRPQQALFGAIKAGQQGADMGTGALEGLSGKDTTQFKEILQRAVGSDLGDRAGKLDLVDIAGFAGDVFLDPVDIALFPVAAGKEAATTGAKVVKGLGTTRDVAKVADTATDVAKIAEDAVQLRSISDLVFGGAYKGTKKTFGFADNIIAKTLNEVSPDTAKLYQGAKDQLRRAFTVGGQEAKKLLRVAEEDIRMMDKALEGQKVALNNIVDEVSKTVFKGNREVAEQAIYDMIDFADGAASKEMTIGQVFNMMKRDRGIRGKISNRIIPYTDDAFEALKNAFANSEKFRFEDVVKVATIKATSGADSRKWIKFSDEFFQSDDAFKTLLSDKTIDKGALLTVSKGLSEKEVRYLENLRAIPAVKDATDAVRKIMKDSEKVIAEFADIPLNKLRQWTKANDWRITHVLNRKYTLEDLDKLKKIGILVGGNTAALRDRIYKMSAIEANRLGKDAFLIAEQSGALDGLDEASKMLAREFFSDGTFIRNISEGFTKYTDVQARSLVRNRSLADILLRMSDSTLKDPQLVTEGSGKIYKDMIPLAKDTEAAVIANKLSKINEIYKNKELEKLIRNLRSKDMYMHKNLLGILSRKNVYEPNAFLVMLSKLNNIYKAGKTFSPTFNTTNLTGNMTQLMLGDMSLVDIATLMPETHRLLSRSNELLDFISKNGLDALKKNKADYDDYQILRLFIDEGIIGQNAELAPADFVKRLYDVDEMLNPGATKSKYDFLRDEQLFGLDESTETMKNAIGVSMREMQDLIDKTIDEALDPSFYEESQEAARLAQAKLKPIEERAIKPKRIGQTVDSIGLKEFEKLEEDLIDFMPTRRKTIITTKVTKGWVNDMNKALDDIEAGTAEALKIGAGQEISEESYNAFKKLDAEFGTSFASRPLFDIYRAPEELTKKQDIIKGLGTAEFKVAGADAKDMNTMFAKLYQLPEHRPKIIVTTSKGKKSFDTVSEAVAELGKGNQADRQLKQIFIAAQADIKNKVTKTNYFKLIRERAADAGFDLTTVYGKEKQAIDDLYAMAQKGDLKGLYSGLKKNFPQVEIKASSIDIANADDVAAAMRNRTRLANQLTDAQKASYVKLKEAEDAKALEVYQADLAKQPAKTRKKLNKSEVIKKYVDRKESDAFLDANTGAKKALEERAKKYELFKKLTKEERDAISKGDTESMIKIVSKYANIPLGKVKEMIDWNMKINQVVDSYSRLTYYLFLKNDMETGGKVMKRLGITDPMEGVRKVLFDPSDVSYFEDDVMKKIIPFYTFTKKNLMFQMQNLAKNSAKYHRLYKGVKGMWEGAGVDWNTLSEYQRNQLYIPFPSLDKDGNYTYFKANLPFADFVDFTSDPLKKVIGMTGPVVKAPFEMVTNTQIFSGQPIEKYEGQMSTQIPWMTNKGAYLASQTGWDVPAKLGTNIIKQLTGQTESTGNLGLDALNALNFTKQGSVAMNESSQVYQELEAVRNYMTKLKAQGVEVKTISEIENQNKVLNDLKAKLSKYR